MDYVPYAVPFFLLAILVELTYGFLKKNNTYRLNDAISSLFMGSLRTANKMKSNNNDDSSKRKGRPKKNAAVTFLFAISNVLRLWGM